MTVSFCLSDLLRHRFSRVDREYVVRFLYVVTACVMIVSSAWAGEPEPVGRWRFDGEDVLPLTARGKVKLNAVGPRPPVFPDFSPKNKAAQLNGKGQYLVLNDDAKLNNQFDFTNGDEITMEAWVQANRLSKGQNVYIIGKGRTGADGFGPHNQNWALRITEAEGKAVVSFLFATGSGSGGPWHRWTTHAGFIPGKMWHHLSLSYRFGDPKSIRGWIDGGPQTGYWDLNGETTEPPVVDDDAVWIGSALGGASGNSFNGSLDNVAIYRSVFEDKLVKSRYTRVGGEDDVLIVPAPEIVPEFPDLKNDQVLMAFFEGMPSHNRWLNTDEKLPKQTFAWNSDVALLDRLPQRFDDWGIRAGWKRSVLVRIAADVALPPGKRRFLMRVRGLSRLWVDGKIVGRSKPHIGSPSGEEPVTPVAEPLTPGMRVAEHRQQEVVCEATVSESGRCRVILETLVGGSKFRTDPGESCLAVESEDGESFALVQGAESTRSPVLMTEAEFVEALATQEKSLQVFDDKRRRKAASSQDEFWNKRHEFAAAWVEENSPPQLPDHSAHPVDAFVNRKVERALAASAQDSLEDARHFHDTVLPILRDNCFRCHAEKASGGLALNSRESVLKGGDSELAAVVPGDVAESELLRRVRTDDVDERMPPSKQLSEESAAILEAWVQAGAIWPAPPVTKKDVAAPPTLADSAFIRRVYLDAVGVVPDAAGVQEFLEDTHPDKRTRLVDQLLQDERFVDHWMPYWQDVLAENPTLINASLNTTGPFRWFLYDAMRDHKAVDRMVTELVLLRGDPNEGGSAGFGIAANNDAPMAAKAQIVASAFLGTVLQCARCHDSPYHSTLQSDLYSLAAMFKRKPLKIPATSRVPDAFFADQTRESLIRVTLKPDAAVKPNWPFADITGVDDDDTLDALLQKPDDTRERLAALLTSPANVRFGQVVVNRIWRRLMGAGIVEPPHDWEGVQPSHQGLLEWLSSEFVGNRYNLRHVVRLIMTSEAYQRSAVAENRTALPEQRFFVAPDRRRMSAEQVVDSLFAASGQAMDVEELTFDPDARRLSSNRLTLGVPTRAWMFASLANERDRPSLGLPRARAITDVMKAFGWNGSRQNPRTDREVAPNVLQPGVLANSTLSVLLTRAADRSGLAQMALTANTPAELVDSVFLRYLSRLPRTEESEPLVALLADGFEDRIVPAAEITPATPLPPLPRVTWSNHQRSESNSIALKLEERARAGAPPDARLASEWREAFEDVVWSVANLSEFVWLP